MGTTKKPSVSSGEKVRRTFPPCPAESDAGKTVKITMYDPKRLIDNRNDLKNGLMQVQVFYNGLKNILGLNANLSTDMATYTFNVTYKSSGPTETEIQNMGRMDFPMYVFNSPGLSSNLSTVEEIHHLMVRHQLSARPRLWRVDGPNVLSSNLTIDVYKQLSNGWGDKLVMGFGFPGLYYDQGTCHKLGIIKIDSVLKNASFSAKNKFKWVIIHELGHMLALAHNENTVMNEKYKNVPLGFTLPQIGIIRDTLKKLSP